MNNVTVTKKERSTVEITGELPAEHVASFKEKAARELGKDVSVPGFRKGHVPLDQLTEKLGADAIWQKAAEHALRDAYPQIITENKIGALGRPNISITKLAPDNPLGFKIVTAVLPDVELPDYKKLAAEHDRPSEADATVTDEEFEKTITDIKQRVQQAEEQVKQQQKEAADETDTPAPDVPIIGEDKEEEKELPELTDDFVQKLGDYKDVEDFKSKLREEMAAHKNRTLSEKWRAELLDKIVDATKTELPDMLVDAELGKMIAQFRHDAERMGMKFDDYLQHIKKTEDELKQEWRSDAAKRAKSQLVLNAIADAENLDPDKEVLEKEMAHVLEHHTDADKDSVRIYLHTMLTNQKVFEFLEQQAK